MLDGMVGGYFLNFSTFLKALATRVLLCAGV